MKRQTLKLVEEKKYNSIWPYYVLKPLDDKRHHKLRNEDSAMCITNKVLTSGIIMS